MKKLLLLAIVLAVSLSALSLHAECPKTDNEPYIGECVDGKCCVTKVQNPSTCELMMYFDTDGDGIADVAVYAIMASVWNYRTESFDKAIIPSRTMSPAEADEIAKRWSL